MRLIDLSLGHVRLTDPELIVVEPQTRYGPRGGSAELREAIAHRHGVPEDQVTVTTGASMGLVATLASLPARGRVVLPRPYYPPFPRVVEMLGFEPVYYDLRAAGDRWVPDLEQVRQLLATGPAALMWNYPHNPTGALDDEGDHARVLEWAARTGTVVVSDRVYGDIVYHDISSRLRKAPHPNEVQLHSFSKTYRMSGERLGYAIAAPARASSIEQAHWSLAMSPPAASQTIALRALSSGHEPVQRTVAQLGTLRSVAVEAMSRSPVEMTIPAAGIFLWVGLPGVTTSSKTVAEVCGRAGVLVVPGAAFGVDDGVYLRISFAVPRDDLVRGLEIVSRVTTAMVERSRPLNEVEQIAVGVDEVVADRARHARGG